VIETPAIVEIDVERLQQLLHLPRERRVARRRVLNGEQLARKAAEVVNRPRGGHRRNGELRDVPVRGNAQHRARPRQARAERRPGLAVLVVSQRIHGIAVTEEDRGHAWFYSCHGRLLRLPGAVRRGGLWHHNAARCIAEPTSRNGGIEDAGQAHLN
jgi:hypothetical protein